MVRDPSSKPEAEEAPLPGRKALISTLLVASNGELLLSELAKYVQTLVRLEMDHVVKELREEFEKAAKLGKGDEVASTDPIAERAWLTSDQAAEALGIKVKTLWNWVSKGRISAHKFKGNKRGRSMFLRGEVEALIRR